MGFRKVSGFLSLFPVGVFACGPALPTQGGGGTEEPGTPGSGSGRIQVDYSFQGVEAPAKINLELIDGSQTDLACATLPYEPSNSVMTSQENLPISGLAEFTNIPQGHRWIIRGTGINFNGVRVAEGCLDMISVTQDQATPITLSLENRPLQLSGPYIAAMQTSILQIDSTYLALISIGCEFIEEIPTNVCSAIVTALQLLGDLDVEANWNFQQTGDSVTGSINWIRLEGFNVTQVPGGLSTGNFSATVVGATKLEFKSFNMTLNTGQLVLFLVEEVLAVSLPDSNMIQSILYFLSPWLQGQITVPTGSGILADYSFNGSANRIDGVLHAHSAFPDLGFEGDLDISFSAIQ